MLMAAALTDAMGPMAKIVLRDQIKTLGESSERFPQAKVDMLLESVSARDLRRRNAGAVPAADACTNPDCCKPPN